MECDVTPFFNFKIGKFDIEIERKFKEGEVKKEGREKNQRYSTPILKKSFIIGIKLSVSRALRMVGWLGTSVPCLHPAIRSSGLMGTEEEAKFFYPWRTGGSSGCGKVHVVREVREGVLGRGRRLVDSYFIYLFLFIGGRRVFGGMVLELEIGGVKWLLCSRRANGNFVDL